MADNNSIEIGIDKETENYVVYESADGDTIVGMYVSNGAAESIGDYGAVTLDDDAQVEATKDKETTNYGVYSTEGGAISGMYVAHSELDSEETEDGLVAPDSIGLTIAPSTEDAFEDAQGADEAEEEALVAGDATEDEDGEEVEIEDEELGLVDAE